MRARARRWSSCGRLLHRDQANGDCCAGGDRRRERWSTGQKKKKKKKKQNQSHISYLKRRADTGET
ncbi:hypothetical protein PVAP13_9KG461539 [Panicum virgatum]|uniref:Uncharacterized protein n=1 Tax=Panicum virgatum TaxID=38727 RepID=A0A8T0NCA9_PANVG|nr:hypothetical protein PVAP13_9KG461539 [Panicum virgatum]